MDVEVDLMFPKAEMGPELDWMLVRVIEDLVGSVSLEQISMLVLSLMLLPLWRMKS